MKKVLFLTMLLLNLIPSLAKALTIMESAGWIESASVKWQPVEGVVSYRVYYSGEGISERKIDDSLIRKYGTYYRADVLGLKAGKYSMRVVPIVAGVEGVGALSDSVTVEAHDRTGFAFSNNRIPGAYKADGTPKDNAVILYITEKSKNVVSMTVTSANTNPCVGLQTILDGFKKGKDLRPLIVRLVGQISDLSYMLGGDIVIENDNNAAGYITFEGVGDDAVADGWGIRIKNASNVEIRNIGSMNCNSSEGDNIGLQQDNDHIWVHHCDLFYGNAGSDADQIKGDGSMDCKKSTYVTLSYNHFWDSGKCNLLGLSEGTTAGLYITYHHNWYDHSDSRHPRVRYYSAHVYNNYYDGNAKYGVGSTMGSSVFVEANYFRNCKYPMLTSMQGTDVWDESTQANDYTDMPTFSKENGGTIKAFNNYMTGQHRFVPYGNAGFANTTVDFDAYVVSSRKDTVPGTVLSYQGTNKYNNFDTNASVMYAYIPDTPDVARQKVISRAGRVHGGDLKWTFNNAVDDGSYDVNTALKAALTAYKTSLVSIQGDSTSGGGTPIDTIVPPIVDTASVVVHNFTTSGKTSTFFTISGNLSTSKGTETYSGLTLTQCLKMESETLISFTTTQEATLTLVFNAAFSGMTKVDGTSYSAVSGILTRTLATGSHQIAKTDAANLYYISLAPKSTDITDPNVTTMILYPNPVQNYLTLSSVAGLQMVEFYTMTGLLVISVRGTNTTVDVSALSPGSYLVKVFTDRGTFRQVILKK
jgi:pectate lyase